jgi:TetR/AcrR family transcriptional regulator, upper aerobic nicotinate degradation pathway regulator
MARTALKSRLQTDRAPRSNGAQRKGRSEAILEAAFRLFAEQGYTGISIKDIAAASRINSALIYYYFASKDHLFIEVLKYAVRRASARRHGLGGSRDDPVSEINLWFDTNEKLAKPLGQMLRLMLDYRASRIWARSVERLIRDFYDTELVLLKEAIGSGIKRGLFRPLDATKAALFISTHLDGLVVAAVIRSDFDLPAGLRQLRKVLFAYLGCAGTRFARRQNAAQPERLRVVA